MNQLLELPPTHKTMNYGVGYQGITILTQSQFKVRYSGLTNYEQVPTKGFIKKKKSQSKKVSKQVEKYRQFKRSKTINKPRQYTIKKSLVRNRILSYINSQSGSKMLYFWTVTFPDKTPDAVALLLLNKWLTRLRQENKLRSYLWVNERQKNGTLHYHIAIPHRLDVKIANRYMRASVMTCIDQKLINYTREQAKNYNGVDISKDRATKRVINFAKRKKQKSLINYITKYVTKNTEIYNQLAWHNSRDFSNLIIRVNLTYDEWRQTQLPNYIDTEKKFENEHFTFLMWKGSPPGSFMDHIKQVQQIVNNLQ
jgi:hypothetical protein